MGALPKPKEEMFVREWLELALEGREDAREIAYAKFWTPGAANARRKGNTKAIKARFQQLFSEAMEYRDVRIAVIVNRIDRVARANIVDFFEKGEDGKLRLKDLTALPRELTDALASIEWDDAGHPKLKLWDKNQANFTLLKHFGPQQPGPTQNVNVTMNTLFADMSLEDQRIVAEALETIAARPDGAGNGDPGEHRPE